MLLSVGTESSSASASISVKIWDLRPRALSLVSTMDVPRVMPPYGSIPQQPLSLHFAPDGSTYTLVYNRQAILYHAVGPSAGKIASIIPSPSNSNKLTAFSYLGEGTQSTTTTTTTPSTLNSSAGSILALVGYENGDIRLVDTRSGQVGQFLLHQLMWSCLISCNFRDICAIVFADHITCIVNFFVSLFYPY